MLEAPSYHAIAAMAVTIAMFIGFARGRYPEEIISLVTIAVIGVGLYFAPLEGTKPTDGLAIAFGGFGHSALITICALMIMGRGLVVTGALEPFARLLETVFRFSPQIGLLTALLLAFGMSMFVNDTPVMVLLIPIIVGIAAKGLMASSKILMPVNTAVLLGGMAVTGLLAQKMLPSAMEWAQQAPREMRQLAPKLRELTKPVQDANRAAENIARAAGGDSKPVQVVLLLR